VAADFRVVVVVAAVVAAAAADSDKTDRRLLCVEAGELSVSP
jgi:hypothetical protein